VAGKDAQKKLWEGAFSPPKEEVNGAFTTPAEKRRLGAGSLDL